MMASLRRQLNSYNPLGEAPLFGLAAVLCLPGLLFSRLMPAWSTPLALAGLALIFGLRWLAVGRLTGSRMADGALLGLLLLLPLNLLNSLDDGVTRPLALAVVAGLALCGAVAAQTWLPRQSWLLLLAGLGVGVILLLGTRLGSNKLPFIDREIYSLLPGGYHAFWDRDSFNPNLAGGLAALFLLPAVALALKAEQWPVRDAAKIIAIALALLLLLTQSRGALLASGVGLAVMSVARSRRWLVGWLLLAALVAGLALWLGPAVLFDNLLGRSQPLADSSLRARLELWQRALVLAGAFPLTGVGLGLFEAAVKLLAPTELISAGATFGHAHNIYLQLAAEMGLPALGLHLALFATLAGRLARAAGQSALALGLLGSLAAFLTHGLFDAIIASPQVALVVWGLFGAMLAASEPAGPINN